MDAPTLMTRHRPDPPFETKDDDAPAGPRGRVHDERAPPPWSPQPPAKTPSGEPGGREDNAGDRGLSDGVPSVPRLGALARYCRWSHDRPWTGFCGVALVAMLFVVVVAAANLAEFSGGETDKEWSIREDPATQAADAAEAAIARVDTSSRTSSAAVRGQESEGGTLLFHFETKSGASVFNPDSLRFMKEVDDLVMSVPGYADYCRLEYHPKGGGGCVERMTPVLHFFPTEVTLPNGTVAVVPDGKGPLVKDIDAVVRSFASARRKFGYYLGGDFDEATLVSSITRAKYPMGAPLFEDEQEMRIGEGWLDAVEAKLLRRFDMRAKFLSSAYMNRAGDGGDTDVRWYAGHLRSQDSDRIIAFDLAWAFASILAVFGYMAFHTGSVFIASLGMFEILISFPISIFIYRVVFGISYLGTIQVLSIFVVLGIGADDVFVFYDAFKQSACEDNPRVSGELLGRVTYTARRASKAIFVTSFTTMTAFLATAMSKVMPISAFGILSATMIFVLFAVNVMFFPPALVLYSKFTSRCCACGGKGKKAPVDDSHLSDKAARDAEAAVLGMNVAALRPIERFFHGPFHSFVSSRARYPLVAGFLALLVTGAMLAARLETPAQQEQWYPSDHMMQAFSNNRRRFMSSDEDRVVAIDILWGLDGMDISGVDRWNPRQRGVLRNIEAFDASSEAAQSHLLRVCEDVKMAKCEADGCTGGTLVRNGANGKVVCPMEMFARHVERRGGTFPVPQAEFLDTLYAFVTSKSDETNRSDGSFEGNLRKYFGFEDPNPDGSTPRLFYHRITVESTLTFPTTARISRPVYDEWEAFVGSVNARAPPGVSGAIQTGYFTWMWMRTQEELVESTLQGLVICFVVAFTVLVVSTMDLRVGLVATVTIVGVVTSVMGVGVRLVMGWDLGIGESIAAVILIGLSVDYCVHLANAFVEAPEHLKTRKERVQHALMTMGVSVTASGVTTILSGSMLWLCILTFFSKFAFLITATIGSSFAWSVLFLPACLMIAGPHDKHSWSDLHPLAKAIAKRFSFISRTDFAKDQM